MKSTQKELEYSRRYNSAHREEQREASRKYRAENPEKARESCRKWREKNPGRGAEATRQWAQKNPGKAKAANVAYRAANPDKASEWAKNWRKRNPDNALRALRARTGIEFSWEDFEKLKMAQADKCAICDKAVKLCVDHCHTSRQVRGLLCRKCNSALGLFNENFSNLIRAADYIRRNTSVPRG